MVRFSSVALAYLGFAITLTAQSTTLGHQSLRSIQKQYLLQGLQQRSLAQIKAYDETPDPPPAFQPARKTILLGTSALLLSSFGLDVYMRQASKKQRYESVNWWLMKTNEIGE
ncbi:hypothetical protein RZS08_41735, partial [Arthrospira platensis SPKY1]|nr:hypothetical protein [Arthrospira platensis SPKY1]